MNRARVLSRLHGRRWGIFSVAVLLMLLTVVVIVGSDETGRAAARSQRSQSLSVAYRQAASAVADEESLERKYRLEPGPEPLAGHTAAEQALNRALATVDRLGTDQDRALTARVRVEHDGYVKGAAELFAAVDQRKPSAVLDAIDTGHVDPVFDAMQTQIYGAAAGHESSALRDAARTRHTAKIVLALDLATLGLELLLITAAGIALTRSHRRLQTQNELNRHQAFHDTLTGLPNRALFQDRAGQALRAAGRTGEDVAIMLIDLDRFKDVNDTLGHHYGDLLLQMVAERFRQTVRASDSVARLGGDEFAVLLCATSHDDAIAAAQRLTDALKPPFFVKDISLDIEASIGIALTGPDTDVETALRHADVAMYEAKNQHTAFTTYELSRDDNTVARLALLGDLRRGIANRELVLHYQPKVSTGTGVLHSVEALVRWKHPTRGWLAPDQFIPVAESTAVIHPLTSEILRMALAQARSWLDRGWRVPVAVNISARSLLDLTFPDDVRAQLDAAGLPADLLSLELTESAIMNDPGRARTVLMALNDMGVCLSIDDFGTGYSSMAYLKALPVRELKIDRSFVMGMTTDDSDAVLVQSAVDLGHNLGLHVVAEGVEDATTQDALALIGCDLVQGYHIRRPVPADEFEGWLDAHATRTSQVGEPRA